MLSANTSKQNRRAVYRRDGWRCALCDSTKYLQIHHVVPRGKGGPQTQQNMITLCADCHALAHGTDLRGLGARPEDVEEAIVEYMADRYAEDGILWNPWDAAPRYIADVMEDDARRARRGEELAAELCQCTIQEAAALGMSCTTEDVEALLEYLGCEDPTVIRRFGPCPPP